MILCLLPDSFHWIFFPLSLGRSHWLQRSPKACWIQTDLSSLLPKSSAGTPFFHRTHQACLDVLYQTCDFWMLTWGCRRCLLLRTFPWRSYLYRCSLCNSRVSQIFLGLSWGAAQPTTLTETLAGHCVIKVGLIKWTMFEPGSSTQMCACWNKKVNLSSESAEGSGCSSRTGPSHLEAVMVPVW